MLIISSDAETEAGRLAPHATRTRPDDLAPQTLEQLTNMDGGVLVDPRGRCHAIGVILDGTARQNGDPSRGSRYNNAIRYIGSNTPPAVVLCYSSAATSPSSSRSGPVAGAARSTRSSSVT